MAFAKISNPLLPGPRLGAEHQGLGGAGLVNGVGIGNSSRRNGTEKGGLLLGKYS
jgi:hypothetical protein